MLPVLLHINNFSSVRGDRFRVLSHRDRMQTPQQNALDICTKLSAVPRRLLVPCASRVGSPKISISYPSANNIRIHRARARAHPARHLHDDEIRCRRPKKIIGDARLLFQTKHRLNIFNSPLFRPHKIILPIGCTLYNGTLRTFCDISMFQLFISGYFL